MDNPWTTVPVMFKMEGKEYFAALEEHRVVSSLNDDGSTNAADIRYLSRIIPLDLEEVPFFDGRKTIEVNGTEMDVYCADNGNLIEWSVREKPLLPSF